MFALMKRSTHNTTSESSIAARLASILEHRLALRARRADLVQHDLAIPATVGEEAPPPPMPAGYLTASQMVNGFAAPVPIGGSDAERRHQIRFELREIEKADRILVTREIEARGELIAQVMAETESDWKQITRERVDALLALRRANTRAKRFRDALVAKTGLPATLPCDRLNPSLFMAPPAVSDATYVFLQDCCALGLTTEEEIADASK